LLISLPALPACIGAILFLLLRILAVCLPWQDLPSLGSLDTRILSVCLPWQDLPSLGALDPRALYAGIALLRDCGTASGILFWVFLVSFAAVFVLFTITLVFSAP
jgi:hypothetical protein